MYYQKSDLSLDDDDDDYEFMEQSCSNKTLLVISLSVLSYAILLFYLSIYHPSMLGVSSNSAVLK